MYVYIFSPFVMCWPFKAFSFHLSVFSTSLSFFCWAFTMLFSMVSL